MILDAVEIARGDDYAVEGHAVAVRASDAEVAGAGGVIEFEFGELAALLGGPVGGAVGAGGDFDYFHREDGRKGGIHG